MRIEVFLDDKPSPIQVLTPPEKFQLDTNKIEDGKHELTFKVFDKGVMTSVKVVPFIVQNGPTIDIHGIQANEKLSGQIDILANAYGASIGDDFEPVRMETPAPVPTWAWVLFLSILAWGAGYISLEVHDRVIEPSIALSYASSSQTKEETDTSPDNQAGWKALGEQVYGNNCSSCHQSNGMGLPNVFPPLKGNSAVVDADPTLHIEAILNGVYDKVIDGVAYASPMPGFAAILNDEEIAAVVNHERTQWGNNAPTVTADDVKALRSK